MSPYQTNGNGQYSNNNSYNKEYNEMDSLQNGSSEQDERGRSTRKKRDFFGTLKRRLGRSKSRAKSMERAGMIPVDPDNPNGELRSVSADRQAANALGNNIGGGVASNTSTGKYCSKNLNFSFPLYFYINLFISFNVKIR